jgi:hypothetical protein
MLSQDPKKLIDQRHYFHARNRRLLVKVCLLFGAGRVYGTYNYTTEVTIEAP